MFYEIWPAKRDDIGPGPDREKTHPGRSQPALTGPIGPTFSRSRPMLAVKTGVVPVNQPVEITPEGKKEGWKGEVKRSGKIVEIRGLSRLYLCTAIRGYSRC